MKLNSGDIVEIDSITTCCWKMSGVACRNKSLTNGTKGVVVSIEKIKVCPEYYVLVKIKEELFWFCPLTLRKILENV